MSGGNFFGRILTQLVDRVVTEKLANSKAFQKAAIKTAEQVAKSKKAAAEIGNNTANKQKGIFNNISKAKETIKSDIKNEIGYDSKNNPVNSIFGEISKVREGLKREIQEEMKKLKQRDINTYVLMNITY